MPILEIVQAGHPALRQVARTLTPEEIKSCTIQELIKNMQQTMHAAPGVGLAAPQIGESLQLLVIEDKPEYTQNIPPSILAERERSPTAFQVIINPSLTILDSSQVSFFEGCLSVAGFVSIVPRARAVEVVGLNEHAEPIIIQARGWYARILQHEVDHLQGNLCIDRAEIRSFMLTENYNYYWKDQSIAETKRKLLNSEV